jgi:cystathionine beta-lyase
MDLDGIIERRGTDSYKWDDNERLFGRRDLMPFWVADMDFATPGPILDAIRDRCAHPVLGYGRRSASHLDAVRDWMGERHDWDVPQDWLMFCPPSAIVGIYGLVAKLTEVSASILVHTPAYGPLLALVRDAGRKLIECPLAEVNGRFGIDTDATAGRLRPDTQMIILCNPHNPTGRALSMEELSAIANLADEHNLFVVSDEVHCDLVMPGYRHVPFGKVGGNRSVTVISPNKTFNTAGIPQATLIIPDAAVRQKFQSYLNLMQLNHDSTFGAIGMLAGYRQCGHWLDQVIDYISANHAFAARWLQEKLPVVRKVDAEATYLAWLDFRATGLAETDIMHRLVWQGGVGLYPGTDFGAAGQGFFRMNLACPRALLKQGLEGIRIALAETPRPRA